MKHVSVVLTLLTAFSIPTVVSAQDQKTSPPPPFTARLEEILKAADEACAEMANNNLPLRDEQGRPLSRRLLEGFRPSVEDVRRLNQQLAARPGDFTLATNLFLHTSDLANAMFDFSQTAYDNDRETLGRRLAEISGALEQSQQQIETHMLGLAAELAQRVRRLEEENQDLKRKLDEALAKLKEIPRPQ